MKYLIAILSIVLFAASAMAREVALDAEYFRQVGFEITPRLSCWDHDMSAVTIFGYYATEEEAKAKNFYQDIIKPSIIEKFGEGLILELPESMMEIPGRPLHHVGIDYRGSKKCTTGFSGDLLTR